MKNAGPLQPKVLTNQPITHAILARPYTFRSAHLHRKRRDVLHHLSARPIGDRLREFCVACQRSGTNHVDIGSIAAQAVFGAQRPPYVIVLVMLHARQPNLVPGIPPLRRIDTQGVLGGKPVERPRCPKRMRFYRPR